MSGVEYPSFVSTRVDSLIAVRGIRRRIVSAGDTLCGFPALILIFHPTDGFVRRISSDPSAVNDASVVFRLIYGDFSFLLTGDAEHDSEIEMSPFGGLLHSDVLKVAHHGSATASSDSFRRLVAPDYAIVQVARFNRFGLPSPTVCRCYREEGAELIRTCDNGAVVFFTDGCTLKRRR